jgi:hypothetical protein
VRGRYGRRFSGTARCGIGGYVDRYHHRPHSGLDYRTPLEVRQTWEDLQNIAA